MHRAPPVPPQVPRFKNGCFPEAISLRSEAVAGKRLQRETGEGTDEDGAPLITSPEKKKQEVVILVSQYRRFRGMPIEPEERGREKKSLKYWLFIRRRLELGV